MRIIFYPSMESVKTHNTFSTIIPFNSNQKVFSYITGYFHHKYSRGNLYVMVVYDFGSTAILSRPIKNRQAGKIRDAFLKMHKILKSIGNNPKVYIMDNDCYSDLKQNIKRYNTNFQIAPPSMHLQNSSERAI